jgi:hypothetical protein
MLAVAGFVSKDAFASSMLACVAIAIGFLPMRIVARYGIGTLPAVWMAATTVRLFAGVGAVAVLVAMKGMQANVVVPAVLGTYLVLLALETTDLIRLVRQTDSQAD